MAEQEMSTYAEIAALPNGTVVRDAKGGLWMVSIAHSPQFGSHVTLCTFSDEYGAMVNPDNTFEALGRTVPLPLQDTGLKDERVHEP